MGGCALCWRRCCCWQPAALACAAESQLVLLPPVAGEAPNRRPSSREYALPAGDELSLPDPAPTRCVERSAVVRIAAGDALLADRRGLDARPCLPTPD